MGREWSAKQLAVFDDVENGEGHTVVLARAGSGKTTVVLESLSRVPAGHQTLMVAFNKKIATELQSRAGAGVRADISTLHSYGLKTVTRGLGRLRIDGDRTWKLADKHIDDTYQESPYLYRSSLCKVVGLAKGSLISTETGIDQLVDSFGIDTYGTSSEQFCRDVLTLLKISEQPEDGCIDFDDMIWLPHVLDLKPQTYDRVFIDETQDLNAAQLSLALKACNPNGRICAVGDNRQAIYAFRGADRSAISNIIETLDAKTLPLSITYRCAQSIVREAQKIVPDLEAAPGAPEGEVAEGSVEDAQAGDFIISRTNAPLVKACLRFLRKGQRATIIGRDIGKQLVAFIKKSKAETVGDLRKFVDQWENDEIERLSEKRRSTELVEDRAATIRVISDGASSVKEVQDAIEDLFDERYSSDRVVLCSTHKAKGLENDRVFLVTNTYRKRAEEEEDNLWYVAVTRAKTTLVKG